jgi:hypothetical protein
MPINRASKAKRLIHIFSVAELPGMFSGIGRGFSDQMGAALG